MRLTQEQANSVIERIRQFAPQGIVCPVCGRRNWNINDLIVESREFHNGDIMLGNSAIMPLVTLTCASCSNTLFLNAIHLGAVDNNNNPIAPVQNGE